MASTKLLDFWAPWCGPCKRMEPIFEELKGEYKDVEFVEINVDEDTARVHEKYGVMGIPTYVVEKDGKEVGRVVGAVPKAELVKLLNA